MSLQIGEEVGPYRIVEQLGQGGMATVYKAYHPQLDRHVAIKVMLANFQTDETFHMRFKREAQIIARLEHAHIVPVYDFNQYQNQPYLVMKYITGQTLKEIMMSGEQTKRQIIDLITDVAAGLTYAHEKGVLHRDIKPSNILVENKTHAYITDFGLARLVQSGQSTYSQDMILGTPHYISPEQAKGSGNDLGPGADIYSLGVVLYEITVGQVPFSASTPYAVVHDHIYTPLPLPSTVNPKVPPAVEMVLLKALAKDPADRYQSAVEMLSAFREALSNRGKVNSMAPAVRAPQAVMEVPKQPVIAKNQEIKVASPQRRNSLWLIAVTVLVTLLVAIIIGALIVSQRPTAQPPNNQPPNSAASIGAAGDVPLYTVPDLSVSDAETAVSANANDPVSHLALAKAYAKEGRFAEAETALRDGLATAPDVVMYLLSGGTVAYDSGLYNVAAVLDAQAFARLNPQDPLYPPVRAFVGEVLYNLALSPDKLDLTEIERLDTNNARQTVLFKMMTARLLITQNHPLLAAQALNRLSPEDGGSPEIRLVNGELALLKNDPAAAGREWRMISTPDFRAAPWIKDRALELLQSTPGA